MVWVLEGFSAGEKLDQISFLTTKRKHLCPTRSQIRGGADETTEESLTQSLQGSNAVPIPTPF
jgi:hypothetical protein